MTSLFLKLFKFSKSMLKESIKKERSRSKSMGKKH